MTIFRFYNIRSKNKNLKVCKSRCFKKKFIGYFLDSVLTVMMTFALS